MAGRIPQWDLLNGQSSQRSTVSAVVRRPADRLSDFRLRRQPERPTGSSVDVAASLGSRGGRPARLPPRRTRSQQLLRSRRRRSPVSELAGGRSSVTFHLVHRPEIGPAQSPFRIVQQETGREVAWINRFLDREWVRRLAETTLRSYALDLLHFLRWWVGVHHTDVIVQAALTESTLLDYVAFQSGQQPRPAAASINRRIVVAERALRNEFPDAPCQFAPGFHQIHWRRAPMGIGRPRLV